MPPALHGRLVILRPAAAAPALLAILDQPVVAEWWRRDEWERLDETDAVTFAIVRGGADVGCIQYNEKSGLDYFSATIV